MTTQGKMSTAAGGPDLPANPFGSDKVCATCGFYAGQRMHPAKGLVGLCRESSPQTTAMLVPVMRRKEGAILTAPDVKPETETGLELRIMSFWPDEILGGHWCGRWVPAPGNGARQ